MRFEEAFKNPGDNTITQPILLIIQIHCSE